MNTKGSAYFPRRIATLTNASPLYFILNSLQGSGPQRSKEPSGVRPLQFKFFRSATLPPIVGDTYHLAHIIFDVVWLQSNRPNDC